MRHRKLALATPVVALLAVVLMASPAWAALVKAADWRMNETSGNMIDSSRHHNNDTPTHVFRTGSTYVFNGTTSRVVVPDDDSRYDIVRKGLSAPPGGDYKMEIKRAANPTVGKLHCLFKGTGGKVDKVADRDILDGNWHTLECIKTGTSVVARVDGKSYTRAGSADSISSSSNVVVGAKTATPLDDVFDGSMDFVSIDIAQ